MLVYLLAVVVVLVAVLFVYGAGALLHLHGAPLIVVAILIMLAGIAVAAAILVIYFRAKKREIQEEENRGSKVSELDLLLNDANRKLRASQQHGAKSLDGIPLLYLLGESASAKTTLVLRSGLNPELISGAAPRDGDVCPTPLLNLWFTRQAAILEVGEAVRQSNSMLDRLVARTRPRAYRSTFGSAAPARAAVVCVNAEQFLVPDAPTSSVASARAIGTQLREISRLLGAALPVYVIVSKLDRVPYFAEFVRNLSNDEASQILGTTLSRSEASVGVYADQASRELGSALDLLCFTLGEFRVEMLDRETEPKNVSAVYEFPREFGKLRKNLNQYLVELCKPSQLSANPYLRGFYFTGLRAQLVQQMVVATPSPPVQNAPQEVGATRIFSVQEFQTSNRPAVQPAIVSTRAPQWTFLPRLFPETILGDKSALSATQQTASARHFRRILFASLAVIFGVFTVLLLISYLNNAELERRILDVAQGLQGSNLSSGSVPGQAHLETLDQLRRTLVQLDDYHQNGPPWTYRFGLYQGNKLADRARQIYFDHFRTMLLNPAQANIVGYLSGLPDAQVGGADYTAAYNPLKAYLITTNSIQAYLRTTSSPQKSLPQFLTPILLQYWVGPRGIDADRQKLAAQQIEFYATQLVRQNPYAITPDEGAVDHARSYLSTFGAVPRVYQNMLASAEKTSSAVDFNRQYPNSSALVFEPHLVRGAFTRSGFAFMQDAIRHPDRYFQGETWVLGDQAAHSLDASSVSRQLAGMYSSDFVKEWHAFLIQARVAGCGPLQQTPNKLNAFAGPDSPILELFGTVSYNTAVADPQIKAIFQPTQAVVDPNATVRFIGGGNKPYVDALLALAGAVNQFNQSPDTSKDVLNSALSAADIAVQQTAQPFNVDSQMHTEKTVISLLEAPIKCATPPPPPPPPGPPATMCAVLGKFPFITLSKAQSSRDLTNNEQASLDGVNAVFTPGTGKLWTYYNDNLKQWLLQQGSQYVLASNAAGHVGPGFAQFFNRAARISALLFPSGANSASFNFTLRSIPSKGVENASLVVDGQRIPVGSSTQQFRWNGATARQASLAYNGTEALQSQGPWALFQLVNAAQVTRVAGGLQLEFPLEVSGRQIRLPDGTAEVVRFELSGTGAEVLGPQGLSAGTCVVPVTK